MKLIFGTYIKDPNVHCKDSNKFAYTRNVNYSTLSLPVACFCVGLFLVSEKLQLLILSVVNKLSI